MLYKLFKKGGTTDNSFKKATFELIVQNVGKVYKGALKVTQQYYKNKQGDLKSKQAYQKFLGEQSGFSQNEVTELYKAYDYIQAVLNTVHPGVLQYKAYIILYREIISLILHDIQTNRKGTLTLEEIILLDP